MNQKAAETKKIQAQLKKHKNNSEAFFNDILGVTTLEEYQSRVLKTIDENERTAVAACHDVGKTFLMARVVLKFLSTNKNSKVITTAPTFNQVKNILWAELRAAHAKAKMPLGGQLNLTEWNLGPEWFAIGFTPRNEAGTIGEGQGTQSSFQGFHAPGGILVVFDEATGIPPAIWAMAEGLLTQSHVKFVAIGNPTSSSSEFCRCFKDPAWAKVYLSCFDSPNLKANGINTVADLEKEIEMITSMPDNAARKYLDSYKVTKPYLLTAKWVVANAKKWGLKHPLTVGKILGKFPEAGDNTLMPLGFVEEAQMRFGKKENLSGRKTIGVDVARFGTDSSVLTALHDLKQLDRREFFKFDLVEVTGEVINLSRDIGGADIIVVDETGLGSGVVDNLKEAVRTGVLPKDCEIRGVQFGAGCEEDEDKEKFANIKARMFSLLADDIKKDDGLSLLPEAVYLEELPTVLYKFDSKGRMVIESKDDYKKRTGRKSPDSADSLALANFGRYDELAVGTFTKNFVSDDSANDKARVQRATIAGGINSQRKW